MLGPGYNGWKAGKLGKNIIIIIIIIIIITMLGTAHLLRKVLSLK